MRLLQYNNDGDFSLTEFTENNLPRYGILSHRWGAEEVTYNDLLDGMGKSKAGYRKIRFCGEQARRDGLQYFWVDTCCIDKSSSAELSEAINSMFRWYQKATRCYVYLSDVSTLEQKASDTSAECDWESAFRASKWFTRGWTLQELLAPRSVEFFSREGKRLGDKRTLEYQIHEITRVPATALRENSLSRFDVNERFSWAKGRQTTRREDKAYSLFGIFDIQMALLYGEGEVKAFQRLREAIDRPLKGSDKDLLRHLPYAEEAPFNSYGRQDEPACLPNTRLGLLQEIYDWADGKDGQDERLIFWLNGLAGTGKSTISRTVARRFSEQKRLGASFFFSRGGGDVSHAGKFVTSLAVQLADAVPSLHTHICDIVRERSDIANLSLLEQWRELVIRPLKLVKLDKPLSPSSFLLVIDALDECDNERHVRTILQLLAEARSLPTVRLRVFLTSRPEVPIRHGIRAIPQSEHQNFVLHHIQPAIINHDISLFLEHSLGIIREERTLGSEWPGDEVLRQLVAHASGLFIWAATACRFIRDGEEFAEDRIDEILEGTSIEGTPEQHLDQIYITVLQNSIPTTFRPPETERLYTIQRRILGSIVILFTPLPAASLAKLIGISGLRITQTLERLHAILDVPKRVTGRLRLHHPAFRDFLLNKDRCGDYWVDEKEAHQRLATSCIQLMSQTLKNDICSMHAPGMRVSQIESSRLLEFIPYEVQYACLYWVQHLQSSGSETYNSDEASRFLKEHLLHWLEALGWMGKISEGIKAILSLEVHVSATGSSDWHAFIHDAKRFVFYNRTTIEQAPLQIYSSALVFAPENSIVRRRFERYIPDWITLKPKVERNWNAALQTLEGHTSSVISVAFSPDGRQVVSGSWDKTVRLWDAATGALQQTLKGHSDSVTSVAFSPDGRQVVSGSDDQTVRLWNTATGAWPQTLEGHTSSVTSVAFSPDGKQVVSGSDDQTVRLWDVATGALQQTLEGHSGWVTSVAFSSDGKQVVSGSDDKTVRLWDATTGALQQTLEGHSGWVTSVAFSPYGKVSTLYISNHWLMEGTTNILLLPVYYRPSSEAVWDRSVILGHWSGRVSFLRIKEGPKHSSHDAATNQGGALPAHDSAIGSLEGSLTMEQRQEISIDNDSGLFSNDSLLDWNNEDDIQSIPSIPDDIQSQSSTKRTAQYKLASDQIGELLARHNQLGPLYEVVLSKIGKKRLVENFRRLLKQYYLDLSQTAQTNLEKASTFPLRSRWNRVRIAQQISDIVDPEIIDDPEPIVSEVPNNKARLESWISSNPGFNQGDTTVNEDATAQQDEIEKIVELDSIPAPKLDSDDSDSNRSDFGHKVEHSNVFPKIAEVEKFFLEGESFCRLLTSLQTFILPVSLSSLTRVLMSVPKNDVWFSDENDNSIMNNFKIAIENITEEDWHWWPMRPKMRMLQGNHTRVHWRCRCGTHLWAELLRPHADAYQALLARKIDDPLQRHHLCAARLGKRFRGAWLGWVHQAFRTVFWPASRTQSPGIPLHNSLEAELPTHRYPPERARTPSGISRSPSIPALATDQGVGVFIPAASELFVLFAVQGARRTLELAHINVDQKIDDEAFFHKIRIRYKEKRGFLRYWLSIWQLKDCEMAMFKKVQKGRVLFTKNDLPTDDLYEYTPRPPMTELPHIFPHEFEFALRPPCKPICRFASFHDCAEPRCGNAILERIPKRKCRLQLTDNQPEEAWGLKAHYTPHFLLVLFYHFLVFVSTFAFWAWWLFMHPDDLQNASVPFMAAVAIVSMFWSSVVTLRGLR